MMSGREDLPASKRVMLVSFPSTVRPFTFGTWRRRTDSEVSTPGETHHDTLTRKRSQTGMCDSALDSVKEHLLEHPHPHVTPGMVEARATVVEDPQRPTAIVFDVEKRRSALGARYREDRPPAAFEAYWERYSYDPQNEELRRLGTNVAERQTSSVSVASVPRLLRDYVDSFLGLLDRAWP